MGGGRRRPLPWGRGEVWLLGKQKKHKKNKKTILERKWLWLTHHSYSRIVFFWFWVFFGCSLSLSPLETKQHPDQKQEHKTTQQKRKSTFFNRASSFWTLPPVVLFNLSDAFAFVRLFASDSRRKKRALFFLSLSKAPERTRKERDEKRKKKLLFLSLFLIEKEKTSLARVPKKQEEEEEEKKHKQKRRGG